LSIGTKEISFSDQSSNPSDHLNRVPIVYDPKEEDENYY